MGRERETQHHEVALSNDSIIFNKKAEWRRKAKIHLNEFLKLHGGLNGASYLAQLHLLMGHLEGVLAQERGFWGGFCGLPDEPNINSLFQRTKHLEWVFPRCVGDELHFSRLLPLKPGEDPTCGFLRNEWGILEPDARRSTELPISELKGILVPARALDRHGVRLGRGKGFYDRALKDFKGLKIGVVFSTQVISGDLPKEEHDCQVDQIITEQGVIACH